MGLDMYLERKSYLGADSEYFKITGNIEIFRREEKIDINFNKVKYIIEEIGYWRKANAIHKWFVDNVQGGEDDCDEYCVSKKQLQELLNIVNQVLENNELANTLLPTESGFFFGNTDYDKRYFEDLENTKKILENALIYEDGYVYYHSSW